MFERIMFVSWLALGCTPVETESNEPSEVTPSGVVEAELPRGEAVEAPPRAESGSVTMEVRPRYTSVLAGKSGTLDAVVRIEAADVAGTRPRLDLAMVLDRSGSMAGEKLPAAKQAALETVRALETGDRITLVAYDDAVVVHARRATIGSREAKGLRKAIMDLEPGGGTALGPALHEGLAVLAAGKRGGDVLAHLMLLSDGLANEGETDPDVIASWAAKAFAKGTAVSTLGVGLDYNEDLMTKIADAGGGRYHFIENEREIGEIVAEELASLTATVVSNVVLTVAPEARVTVEEIPGYRSEMGADGISASVGSIAGGRKRELVVRMQYRAPTGKSMRLGAFTLRFQDNLADGAAREITVTPRVDVTTSAKAVEQSEDFAVTVRVFELEVANTMVEATRAVEDGRFDDARMQLTAKLDELARFDQRPEIDEMIAELREARDGVDRAERDRAERKLYEKGFKSKAYQKFKK